MITKKEYLTEVRKRFDKKLSIDFWSLNFWDLLMKKEIILEKVWELLKQVNKNQT